jgi:mRNA-degrading endonuclease RelE of RelBE toxin-antitoxin system
VSGTLRGVQLEPAASHRLRQLDPPRRKQIAHILEEMVAVVKISWPSISCARQGSHRLYFTASGIRVEYSIDDDTGLLTVHQINDGSISRAG